MPEIPDQPAEPDAPLVPPPAPAHIGAPLSSAGRVDRLMDALDRALRSGDVDEGLLADLNWTPSQARQFLEAYKRVKVGGQRQTERTPLPRQTGQIRLPTAGAGQLQRSDGTLQPSARSLNASHQRAADQTRDLMEVGRQRVTPRYRSLLEAYYQSVSSRPAPE